MSTCTYLAGVAQKRERSAQQSAREAFGRLVDLLVEQGRFALHQLQQQVEQGSSEIRALLESQYLQLGPDGQLTLTPLSLRTCEEMQLLDLFRAQGTARIGYHARLGQRGGAEAGDECVRHAVGDPLDHLDVSATLHRALERGLPLNVCPDDVMVRPGLSAGRCRTMLLLDLSGSMARHGKFGAARRACLALQALIRKRYPGDELSTIGFASRASLLSGSELLQAMPGSVGLFDPRLTEVRVAQDATEVPEHFTNIQAGLRLARQCLRRSAGLGKQVVLITDGEPTAHLEGSELVLAYPPTERTMQATLTEAGKCVAEGIRLSVFGLIGEFSAEGLRSFVERLALAGRGKALCCSPRQLGVKVLETFVQTRQQGSIA